jgi:hypothetical protein
MSPPRTQRAGPAAACGAARSFLLGIGATDSGFRLEISRGVHGRKNLATGIFDSLANDLPGLSG